MPVTRFEDLIAWQKARELTAATYRICHASQLRNDFSLARQMQRAATSIMANIAEGFERSRPAEFHQFLSVAKASCAELRSHLYVALDTNAISNVQFTELSLLAVEVSKIVGGLRASVERKRRSTTL